MTNGNEPIGCAGLHRMTRRMWLKAAGLSGIGWLTPVAETLARAAERAGRRERPRSVILVWLQGGPSQLETFDPHPGTAIAAGSEGRPTSAPGVLIGKGFEQLADLMHEVALVRSVMSKEGDHERATYNMKTGFRPDPTLVHPSLGAIICHQLTDDVEIPRHISILPGQWPSRGGYLGAQYDAFQIGDPQQPIPDVRPRVSQERFQRRVADLNVVERQFARGRLNKLDQSKTLHSVTTAAALRMMHSEQLKAFDVKEEPEEVRLAFGDTPFGRGCLAAVRLIGVGVRCVEVTLPGWDSHANNHEVHAERISVLDPALTSLIRELKNRELLDRTIVICAGEFGRTPGRPGAPGLNAAGGRDHWPHGFSVLLAGGGIRGASVLGETSPEPAMDPSDHEKDVRDPCAVEDIHATVLHALGIDHTEELITPIGRPMALSKGRVLRQLLVEHA